MDESNHAGGVSDPSNVPWYRSPDEQRAAPPSSNEPGAVEVRGPQRRQSLRLLVAAVVVLLATVSGTGYRFRSEVQHTIRPILTQAFGTAGTWTDIANLPAAEARDDLGTPNGARTDQRMTVVATGGVGVAFRRTCSESAPGVDTLPEGARVTVLRAGTDACVGWLLAEWGGDATWVPARYLSDGAR